MKIGQFSDTFLPVVDGVGRVVSNYANTLAKMGEECYVVAPMADTGYRGGMPFELIDFVSMTVPVQKQYSSGIPQLDGHYDARIRMIPLDIIHAHSPFIAGQEALRLGRRRGIPVVGTFHSRYYDDFYKLTNAEMLANIGVKFIVSFYEHCDEVWTVSDSSAETLRDYGYTGEIVVIPNGTPDVTPTEKMKKAAVEAFHLPDTRILLYCGQLNWKKNIQKTLEACALLAGEGKEFTLVLAGQGPDTRQIQNKAEELGIGGRIVYTGHVTDETLLYGLYEAADLFVFPSLYDTSGMVVREAAAMGTPSVVIAGSAAAEPISHGVNGFLCEDCAVSLAGVIREVLDNPERAKLVGASARETIYLSWETILERALERYRLLVEKNTKAKGDS